MKENNKKNIPSFGSGLVVDDGSVTETIRNQQGQKVGEFTFRPSDIGIIDRYNESISKFGDVVAPLENVGLNPDGTPRKDDAADFELLSKIKADICEMVDYIFGGNISEGFFGTMHPLSVINGRLYCENVLDALGNYIAAVFATETKKIDKRVSRYTQQYTHGVRTGKHKNGGKKGSK